MSDTKVDWGFHGRKDLIEKNFSMISEEAEGCFAGQKSPQDVAKIIQSRVELYVKENN